MRENRFIRQKFLVRKSGGRPPEVGVQAGSPPSREFTCTSIRNPAGFCNFSPVFSTAQAIIRGKAGRPEKHLFRRRQSHRPRDADLAGEMPVVGDDEQRPPIPCNGAGKDAEAPEVEVVGRFVEQQEVGCFEQQAAERRLANRIAKLEKAIEETEAMIAQADEDMAACGTDYGKANEIYAEKTKLEERLEALFAEWEELNS